MRPCKNEYYLGIAKEVSKRSTCLKVMIGAIIVRDDQIISTGYVGAPRKTKSCDEHGFCLRKNLNIPSGTKYELCRSVHAEQNAIVNAARSGCIIIGGTIYIYGFNIDKNIVIDAFPCFICKKMIINSGIDKIVISSSTNRLIETNVSDLINEWKEKDLLEDKIKYNG